MENLKNNLSIFSVALLIIGTINLSAYYEFFHVNILSYLDFTEVLQIQFRLFAISVAVLFFYIAYTVIGVSVLDSVTKEIKPTTLAVKIIDKINYSADKYMKFFTKRPYLLVILSFPLVCLLTLNTPKSFYMFCIGWSCFIFALGAAYLHGAFKEQYSSFSTGIELSDNLEIKTDLLETKNKSNKLTIKMTGYLLAFITVSYFSLCIAITSALDVVLYSANNEVTLVTEKESFSTNSSYRLIGKTKNFIFFYNLSKKQAEVFPNSDIKKLSIRDGVRYEEKQDSLYKFNFTKEGLNDWFTRANKKLR